MANLAIKGHQTRGKEVIELLEMLGGNNKYHINITECNLLYTIREGDNVIIATYPNSSISQIYTLEELLEKYPYKIGDKVIAYAEGIIAQFTIQGVRWNDALNKIEYKICSSWYDVSLIMQHYKEETMEERQYEELRMSLDDDDKLATEATISGNKLLPPNGYLIGKITQMDNGMLVEYVKKQPQYPHTYEECCDVLELDNDERYINVYITNIETLENKKFEAFIRLTRCRDVYWKIAGEQMGLDEPWKPDWEDETEIYYTISYDGVNIKCYNNTDVYSKLAFPTEKMRNAFYDNFNDLIEACKELL